MSSQGAALTKQCGFYRQTRPQPAVEYTWGVLECYSYDQGY